MESHQTKQLPDFIIGGAMKSATGTLDFILNQTEEVFIPQGKGEPNFFSIDDITEHRAFFHQYDEDWAFQDYEQYFEEYMEWYRGFFAEAAPDQTIGEDSTIYLASEKAPPRIAEILPDVQLVFLLRDPVDRAYSQYWHHVRTGRAIYRFENALQYGDSTLITRGFYKQQLERYLSQFPREDITIVIFEDFIRNMQDRVNDVCAAVGISEIDLSEIETPKRNASLRPRWPSLLVWQNYLFRTRNDRGVWDHPPTNPTIQSSAWGRVLDSINFRLRYFNLTSEYPPPMDSETRSFLERLYAKENRGLPDLIGIDVAQYWSYMK